MCCVSIFSENITPIFMTIIKWQLSAFTQSKEALGATSECASNALLSRTLQKIHCAKGNTKLYLCCLMSTWLNHKNHKKGHFHALLQPKSKNGITVNNEVSFRTSSHSHILHEIREWLSCCDDGHFLNSHLHLQGRLRIVLLILG